jgi:hypothetical protein
VIGEASPIVVAERFEAMTIGAQGLKVVRVIVGMIAVDVINVDLTGVFWDETTARARGWRTKGAQEDKAMLSVLRLRTGTRPFSWDAGRWMETGVAPVGIASATGQHAAWRGLALRAQRRVSSVLRELALPAPAAKGTPTTSLPHPLTGANAA